MRVSFLLSCMLPPRHALPPPSMPATPPSPTPHRFSSQIKKNLLLIEPFLGALRGLCHPANVVGAPRLTVVGPDDLQALTNEKSAQKRAENMTVPMAHIPPALALLLQSFGTAYEWHYPTYERLPQKYRPIIISSYHDTPLAALSPSSSPSCPPTILLILLPPSQIYTNSYTQFITCNSCHPYLESSLAGEPTSLS